MELKFLRRRKRYKGVSEGREVARDGERTMMSILVIKYNTARFPWPLMKKRQLKLQFLERAMREGEIEEREREK